MKRDPLSFLVVIVAGLCVACSPPVAPEIAPRTARTALCTPGNPSAANNFADAFQVMQSTSTYDPGSANLNPPASSDIYNTLANLKGSAPYTNMWQTLHDAFQLANPRLQKRLCNLAGIFIDERGCQSGVTSCQAANSWGFRDPNPDSNGNPLLTEYVGLSAKLWDSSGNAPLFSQYETNLLTQVLAAQQMPWKSGVTTPTFSTAYYHNNSVDTQAAAVLAALAHEYGHVLWADLVKFQPGQSYSYDPTQYCMDRTDGFFYGSWYAANQPSYYLSFAQLNLNDSHSNSPQISQLKSDINGASHPGGSLSNAATDLNQLYGTEYDKDNLVNPAGVWASLFGAISPEEDFVESFVIYVMGNGSAGGSSVKIDNMQLNIYTLANSAPAYTPNLFQDFANQPMAGHHARKQTLVKKVINCIHQDNRW